MNALLNTFSCLVTRDGRVLAKDGVHSHTRLAKLHGVNEDQCLRYDFDLTTRGLVPLFDRRWVNAKISHDETARVFFEACVGTPERLMEYVKRGNFHEHLGLLLSFDRYEFLKISNVGLAEYASHYRPPTIFTKFDDDDWGKYQHLDLKGVGLAEYERAIIDANVTLEVAIAHFKSLYDIFLELWWLDTYSDSCAAFSDAQAKYNEYIVGAWTKYEEEALAAREALAKCREASVIAWLDLFADSKNRIKIWRS